MQNKLDVFIVLVPFEGFWVQLMDGKSSLCFLFYVKNMVPFCYCCFMISKYHAQVC
jgi:hypothetical protein